MGSRGGDTVASLRTARFFVALCFLDLLYNEGNRVIYFEQQICCFRRDNQAGLVAGLGTTEAEAQPFRPSM